MHKAVGVHVGHALRDLADHVLGTRLFEAVQALVVKVAEEVASLSVLGHDKDLTFVLKGLYEGDQVLGRAAHCHGLALRDLVLDAQSLVLGFLDRFDCNF